jgi:thioredoxin 2
MSDGTVVVAGTNHTMPIVSCPSCGKRNRVPVVTSGTPRCASCHHDLPWVVDAGSADFDEATRSRLPVLVDLWAPWCGPCRIVAPGVERASQELAGRLKVVKVDVDQAPDVSARFDVQGIPTLLVLRDGTPVARQVGALPPDRLVEWVRSVLQAA